MIGSSTASAVTANPLFLQLSSLGQTGCYDSTYSGLIYKADLSVDVDTFPKKDQMLTDGADDYIFVYADDGDTDGDGSGMFFGERLL